MNHDPVVPCGEDAVCAWRTLSSGRIYIDHLVQQDRYYISHAFARRIDRFFKMTKSTVLVDATERVHALHDSLAAKLKTVFKFHPLTSSQKLSRLYKHDTLTSLIHLHDLRPTQRRPHLVYVNGRRATVTTKQLKMLIKLNKAIDQCQKF